MIIAKYEYDIYECYEFVVDFETGAAVEFSERVCFFGIATNLITYLTQVIHQDLETAAKNVNYWSGTTTLLPLVGGFVADAYTGRFYMVLFSSFVYLTVSSLSD